MIEVLRDDILISVSEDSLKVTFFGSLLHGFADILVGAFLGGSDCQVNN